METLLALIPTFYKEDIVLELIWGHMLWYSFLNNLHAFQSSQLKQLILFFYLFSIWATLGPHPVTVSHSKMLSNLTICLVVDEGDGGATAVTIHSVARFGSRDPRVWGLSVKGLARPLSVADKAL